VCEFFYTQLKSFKCSPIYGFVKFLFIVLKSSDLFTVFSCFTSIFMSSKKVLIVFFKVWIGVSFYLYVIFNGYSGNFVKSMSSRLFLVFTSITEVKLLKISVVYPPNILISMFVFCSPFEFVINCSTQSVKSTFSAKPFMVIKKEVHQLLASPKYLKHRLILGM
jgi:hypothetical protein